MEGLHLESHSLEKKKAKRSSSQKKKKRGRENIYISVGKKGIRESRGMPLTEKEKSFSGTQGPQGERRDEGLISGRSTGSCVKG